MKAMTRSKPAPFPVPTQGRSPGFLLSLTTLAVAAGFIAPAAAGPWPAWRGPEGNGISREVGVPTRWSPRENVAWRVAVKGAGSSTPVIWGGRIFLTAQTEDEREWVMALNRADGRLVWEREAGRGMRRTRAGANMASASAATDGERLVATFGTGELLCFDVEGRPLWSRHLEADHGAFTIWWGYSNSPVLHDDLVLVTVINEGPSYVLALDKRTGETRWKTPRKTPATSEACDAYVTPLVYRAGDRWEVFVTGGTWATGYNLADGRLLWRVDVGGDRTIVSPTYYDGMLYVTSGQRGPLFAIEAGDLEASGRERIRWKYLRATPDVPCPLAYGDYVYVINDSGIAMCLQRSTGELVWQERIGGDFKASPIWAEGRLYFLNRDGETAVVAAEPAFRLLELNEIGEAAAMGSLAVADGRLFLRTVSGLVCIGPPQP